MCSDAETTQKIRLIECVRVGNRDIKNDMAQANGGASSVARIALQHATRTQALKASASPGRIDDDRWTAPSTTQSMRSAKKRCPLISQA
jgi:hypothetical protein